MSGFIRRYHLKILYCLVVAMFILLIFSMSQNARGTVPIALGFVGSLMLVLVSLAKDRWLDSGLFMNGSRAIHAHAFTNILRR